MIFERVCYQMAVAGWLRRYGFEAGSGHFVVWTQQGSQKAVLLCDLGERYRLTEFDNYPFFFQSACLGMPPPVFFEPILIETAAFWMLCVGELGLEADADGLLGMMHIVTSWGPGGAAASISGE